jgi:hypothetical protein
MLKLAHPLTDTQVKRAKAGAKPVKLYDGNGSYLEVLPVGSKFWRFRYRQRDGKESSITFGQYPEVGLADARDKRAEARRLLLQGTDPVQRSEQVQREKVAAAGQTFRNIATEWHTLKLKSWSPAYAQNVLNRLEMDIFPDIGKVAMGDITHRDLINVLRKIEARGAHEIAKRNKAVCGQIFSYAIQSGVATRNPVVDMKDVLQVVSPGNFPAISSDELPRFLAALRGNEACSEFGDALGPEARIVLGLRLFGILVNQVSGNHERTTFWRSCLRYAVMR